MVTPFSAGLVNSFGSVPARGLSLVTQFSAGPVNSHLDPRPVLSDYMMFSWSCLGISHYDLSTSTMATGEDNYWNGEDCSKTRNQHAGVAVLLRTL